LGARVKTCGRDVVEEGFTSASTDRPSAQRFKRDKLARPKGMASPPPNNWFIVQAIQRPTLKPIKAFATKTHWGFGYGSFFDQRHEGVASEREKCTPAFTDFTTIRLVKSILDWILVYPVKGLARIDKYFSH